MQNKDKSTWKKNKTTPEEHGKKEYTCTLGPRAKQQEHKKEQNGSMYNNKKMASARTTMSDMDWALPFPYLFDVDTGPTLTLLRFRATPDEHGKNEKVTPLRVHLYSRFNR